MNTSREEELYRLLVAIIWQQPKHCLHVSRDAWNMTGSSAFSEYKLIKADAPDGSVRLTAKHAPFKTKKG